MRIPPKSLAMTFMLSALAALPALAIDIGLPALPALGTALKATPAQTGATLGLFMLGFAAAQLVFGPLSDRYGRRRPLIVGCVIFTLAGIGCTAAPTIEVLLFWRLIQGAGAAAGTVLVFALVRDLFEGAQALAKLSFVNLVMGVAPVLAPTIGAVLLPIAGWRGIYGFLALFGVLVSVASVLGMGESRPGDPSAPVRLGPLMAKYRTLLAERGCSINALVGGLNLAMMFAYITASPLVLMRGLGVSPGLYAAVFACTAGAIVVGSALNGWLAERGVGTSRLLAVGLTLAAASAVCLLAVTASGLTSLVTLVPLLVINTFTIGIVAPNATHAAMQPRPDMAGTAGALAGCFRMLGGAIASLLVGALLPRFGASAMTGTMAACAVLGLLIWTLNFGTPAKAAA